MSSIRTTHRFPIGTQYTSMNKRRDLYTVTDHLTTTNSKGEIVSLRYVASHTFCGQLVTDGDIVDTTIARNLTPEFRHLLTA